MTRKKAIVAALLAVFCVSAMSAAIASANEGTFVNKGGKALEKNKFTGKSGETKLEGGFGNIVAKSDSAVGKVINTEEGEQTVTFKETSQSLLGTCTSAGAKAGEVITLSRTHTRRASQPSGEILLLVQVLNTKHEVATEAAPFEFKCGSTTVKVFGSFLVKTNSTAEKTLWSFSGVSNGKHENTPTEYENSEGKKVKDVLRSNFGLGYENTDQVGTEEVTFEEAGHFV